MVALGMLPVAMAAQAAAVADRRELFPEGLQHPVRAILEVTTLHKGG